MDATRSLVVALVSFVATIAFFSLLAVPALLFG